MDEDTKVRGDSSLTIRGRVKPLKVAVDSHRFACEPFPIFLRDGSRNGLNRFHPGADVRRDHFGRARYASNDRRL